MDKEDFRFMIHKRLETIKKNKKIYDRRIIETLVTDVLGKEKVILAYYPLPDEPDLRDLYDMLIQKRKRVLCAPVYTGDASKIEVRRFASSESFKKWRNKIMNPTGKKVEPKSIELALVPGLAFDRQGYRIGRGGGYFDRLLSLNKKMKKVGVGYTLQLFDSFEGVIEPHDVQLDLIITEEGIIQP